MHIKCMLVVKYADFLSLEIKTVFIQDWDTVISPWSPKNRTFFCALFPFEFWFFRKLALFFERVQSKIEWKVQRVPTYPCLTTAPTVTPSHPHVPLGWCILCTWWTYTDAWLASKSYGLSLGSILISYIPWAWSNTQWHVSTVRASHTVLLP